LSLQNLANKAPKYFKEIKKASITPLKYKLNSYKYGDH
jgi:hypothetical protein